MWSGASAPAGWSLCDGSNGTPDLRDKFVVAAGATYGAGSSGGAATVDIQHNHADGTLAAASDSHNHTDGSLAAASDSHSHTDGSLGTDSDSHGHSFNLTGGGLLEPRQGVDGYNIQNDGHAHDVTGSAASDAHTHGVSGSVASDSHGHTVSGSVANALSTTQEVLPPYYSLAFIMRIS